MFHCLFYMQQCGNADSLNHTSKQVLFKRFLSQAEMVAGVLNLLCAVSNLTKFADVVQPSACGLYVLYLMGIFITKLQRYL